MSEDTPIHNAATVVVNTPDGTVFRCTPTQMGGFATPRAVHWKLVGPNGVEYTGPVYIPGTSAGDLQKLVSEWWWGRKKLLGQQGVNASGLRMRIMPPG